MLWSHFGLLLYLKLHYQDFYDHYAHLQCSHITIIILSLVLVSGCAVYFLNQPRSIYLLDYACFFPRKRLHYNFHHFMEHSTLMGVFRPAITWVPTQDTRALWPWGTNHSPRVHANPPTKAYIGCSPRRSRDGHFWVLGQLVLRPRMSIPRTLAYL